MANEYAVFSTPWTERIEAGKVSNTPKLAVDYPYDQGTGDGISKWQDVTGNYNGVDPNQYQIEIWCNTATMDAIEANPEYTMVPGSWRDLDAPVETPEEP
jgi:hypothetical protein